jgi:hypothetical protein
MPFVVAQPETVAAAAADAATIGSVLSADNAVAAAPTTAVAVAGADEVSAGVATLFSKYGRAYQALSAQAAGFHQQFVQALSAAAGAYTSAEVANANALRAVGQDVLGAVNATNQTRLGRTLIGNDTNGEPGQAGVLYHNSVGSTGAGRLIGIATKDANGGGAGTAATGGASGAGIALRASPSASLSPSPQTIAVPLTNGQDPSSPLGGGIALVMGGSGLPTPYPRYGVSAALLYLQPHGFSGTPQILTTPELTNHFDTSMAEGSQILTNAIVSQIQGGQVDAQNPVVVFGYSQSSVLSTFTMEQLHALGVPSDYVHFVLVGNTANPNGGMLSAFDIPPGRDLTIPGYVTLGHPTPSNLYPTDVYTLEYDGWADFPRYPIDVLSDLNAIVGMYTQHLAYLGLDPSQITNAIPLPTTGDTLVNYYMMPSAELPILEPLRLIPVAGQPLYDLLEPDTRILVNLGYGSITEGWNQGPANVETPVALFPTDFDWSAVLPALGNGAQQGVSAFVTDLLNPETYRITPLVDNPALTTLITAAYRGGFTNNPDPSSLWDFLTSWVTTPPEPS